jgi:hypothetical protein
MGIAARSHSGVQIVPEPGRKTGSRMFCVVLKVQGSLGVSKMFGTLADWENYFGAKIYAHKG